MSEARCTAKGMQHGGMHERVFMSRMVHRQDIVTTRGAPSRLSEEGSATVMVRVRGLEWFGVNAASVLGLATPCKR
jgi:hypothetical protein